MAKSKLLIEGLTQSELLSLEDLEGYAVAGRPIIFSIGSAEILAEFSIQNKVLGVEIAVVEQGGEGVLPLLIETIEQASLFRHLTAIEWSIYARNCANPNPKLSKVLERLNFNIERTETGAEFYWQRLSTNESLLKRH